jgi:hypothetical protein
MSVNDNELKAARAALGKGCGEWETTRQHQVKTTPDPDAGWTGYIGKDFWKTTRFMRELLERAGSRWAVQFQGGHLSTTNAVRARAEALYKAHRAALVAECRQARDSDASCCPE